MDFPIYQVPSTRPRFESVDARANASDFGSSIGGGLDLLARGEDNLAGTIEDTDQKREQLWAQQAATQAGVYWQQKFSDGKTALEADPSKGDQFVNQFKTDYSDYTGKIVSQAPSPRAADMLQAHFNQMGSGLFGDALGMAAKARVDWSTQSYMSSMSDLSTVANGPSANVVLDADGKVQNSSFDTIRQQSTQIGKTAAGIIPGTTLMTHQKDFQIGLDKDEIDQASIQNGAIATAKAIQAGNLGKNMNIPQRLQEVLQLNRQGRIESEQQLKDATGQLEDLRQNLEQGGLNSTQDTAVALHNYASANGNVMKAMDYLDEGKKVGAANLTLAQLSLNGDNSPADKQQAKVTLTSDAAGIETGDIPYGEGISALQKYAVSRMDDSKNPVLKLQSYQDAFAEGKQVLDNAQKVSVIRQQMMTMTPEEGANYYQQLVKTEGITSPIVQRIGEFEQQRQQMILPQSGKFDPVSYTQTDQRVLGAMKQSDSSFQKAMSGDPQAISDVKAGVDATYGMQKQWGATGSELQPISKDKASYLTSLLTSATASPTQALSVVDGIKKAYGDNASDVFRSMVQLAPEGQKLAMPLQILAGLPQGANFRTDFAESMAYDAQKKQTKEADLKQLNSSLDSNGTWQNWQVGLANMGFSAEQVRGSSEQMKSAILNYAQVLNDKKDFGVSNPASAITTATTHILDSLHGFGTSNGSVLMIPRGDGNGGVKSNQEIQNISDNLETERTNIFGTRSQAQSNFDVDLRGLDARFPHLSDEEKHPLSMDDARNNSFWSIGNPSLAKSNQAVLMFRNPDTNQKVPLFDTKGNVITRNLDSMNHPIPVSPVKSSSLIPIATFQTNLNPPELP